MRDDELRTVARVFDHDAKRQADLEHEVDLLRGTVGRQGKRLSRLERALREIAKAPCRKWMQDTCLDHGRSNRDGPNCPGCIAREAISAENAVRPRKENA